MSNNYQLLTDNLKRAVISFAMLVNKLEMDSYFKLKGKLSLAEFIFTDILSFCMLPAFCSVRNAEDQDSKKVADKYLNLIIDILLKSNNISFNEQAFNEFVIQYYKKTTDSILTNIYPESFIAINNFDNSSQFDDGRFYKNLGVENPGRLSEYYIIIIEALKNIWIEISNELNYNNSSVVTDFLESSIVLMNNY